MVATLAKVSSDKAAADYYIESQASHRPAGEYYLAGEEPDGVWWNPHGLFGLEDGRRVDANAFYRLHQGYAPFDPNDPNDLGEDVKLTRNAGSPDRVAAYDLTFSADKSVSTLWAMTHGEDDRLHRELARAHDNAVRSALDLIVDKYCAWTRSALGEDGPLEAMRCQDHGGDIPASVVAGERTAAPYSLCHLQRRARRRRQVALVLRIPALRVVHDSRLHLPPGARLEHHPAPRPRRRTTWPRSRVLPDPRCAPRTPRPLVQPAQDQSCTDRKGAWASRPPTARPAAQRINKATRTGEGQEPRSRPAASSSGPSTAHVSSKTSRRSSRKCRPIW